jgi:hypothetical protein
MSKSTYEFLKDIAKGKVQSPRWDNPDDWIYEVRINEKNPLASQVIIDFDDESDFLKTLGVDEDDIYEYKHIMFYESSDYDHYRYYDEWREGYIRDSFSNENLEKYEQILRLTISPDMTNNYDIMKKLMDLFENEVNNIISIYGLENERCMLDAAKKAIKEETEKPFDRFGITEVWHASRFKTTVGILLNWFRMLKAENKNVRELLTMLFAKYNSKSNIGSWGELKYNSFCDDYDQEQVQREIGLELDEIIEEIEEDGINEDFQKLYDIVVKLGGFNRHIELKDKEMSVVFQSINPYTGRLIFKVYKKDGKSEQRSVDNLEDLYLNLYQPELFESVKDILNKIL